MVHHWKRTAEKHFTRFLVVQIFCQNLNAEKYTISFQPTTYYSDNRTEAKSATATQHQRRWQQQQRPNVERINIPSEKKYPIQHALQKKKQIQICTESSLFTKTTLWMHGNSVLTRDKKERRTTKRGDTASNIQERHTNVCIGKTVRWVELLNASNNRTIRINGTVGCIPVGIIEVNHSMEKMVLISR